MSRSGGRSGGFLDMLRRRRIARPDLGRGVAFVGTVWPGGAAEPAPGMVVVDGRGCVQYLGPMGVGLVPADVPVLGSDSHWIGPAVVDAHVHLAFSSAAACFAGGVVAVRDLGAPAASARAWRTGHRAPPPGVPFIAVAGPILTEAGGYPSRTWGRNGFTAAVSSVSQARHVVHRVAADGADVIKVALEPGDAAWPVPGPAVVRAIVDAAHSAGLGVIAHALTADMVGRAIDSGVDELAHTPTERLSEPIIERIASAGMSVVSTLQTFFSVGHGRHAGANAAALHEAGVLIRYGTDLGNDGTLPGVDPRELDRLADTGLGRLGALRAATEAAARAPGIRRRSGRLTRGEPAALVLLPDDPLAEPGAWRAPSAVLADGHLTVR
jgi:imidazolonepropionase-like amidohydrolase